MAWRGLGAEVATVLQRMAVLQAVPGIGAGDDDTDQL
jgi:hypothetical protein